MIIQTAPPNQPHFAITQRDHARMSGAFAAVFGNDQFAPLLPQAEMAFVAAHHDEGWAETDAAALMDAKTGLPYHLTQTPLPELVKTSARSPEFNEAHHAYSGLLSSMHTYGLFNGRYGLSDKIFIDLVPAEHKTAVATMLDAELARQARLKATLGQEAATAEWVSEDALFANYKLLQFFDTLALYFQMVHPAARTEATFANVPRAVGDDVTLTIRPLSANVYSLSPYPFAQPDMTFSYQGRRLSPQPAGTDLRALLAETAVTYEEIRVVG